ncbi:MULTISPECIES: hypothetical protein [unclassified Xanthobacter]|uniref:hypothetical protein n=1 Tax=unclassified Xanthobacter TaxID=2623496 RepID=UPI001F1C7ADD|nr:MULTISPECIES: hypothetical protein [unclassified Xanthobacter]
MRSSLGDGEFPKERVGLFLAAPAAGKSPEPGGLAADLCLGSAGNLVRVSLSVNHAALAPQAKDPAPPVRPQKCSESASGRHARSPRAGRSIAMRAQLAQAWPRHRKGSREPAEVRIVSAAGAGYELKKRASPKHHAR